MTAALAAEALLHADVEIGGVTFRFRTSDADFHEILRRRYAGFLSADSMPQVQLDVELCEPKSSDVDRELSVVLDGGIWRMSRGDFSAEWDPVSSHGRIRQAAAPYASDAALRIIHSLLLAKEGGFLVHAASAVRNGLAHVFAGVSGAGKTTMAGLAPEDATLLTDEISFVQRERGCYFGCGTPFTGELNRSGENIRAQIGALYFLEQSQRNEILPIASSAACRRLLENVLFFANDGELVNQVFQSVCEFLAEVPVHVLRFKKDRSAWDLIG
ncbi:MAG TPA: hypothetical protein VFO34_00675 [Candidatus Acidoferrales bacterium]|nr:hypothetical protein [Candidatus Acidoferrales bacterium]